MKTRLMLPEGKMRSICFFLSVLLCSIPNVSAQTSDSQMIVGVEYALSDGAFQNRAAYFKPLVEDGLKALKPLPEAFEWDKMQPDLQGPINFSVLDDYVRKYQTAGFEEIFIGLRSRHRIASVNYHTNPQPQEKYRDAFAHWIHSIVERYDYDGVDDMPGLVRPVRMYEIGVEFSSYEPEPVEEYLIMLEIAYQEAHGAYPDVLVLHVPFLVSTVMEQVLGNENPTDQDYKAAFAKRHPKVNPHHGYEDAQKLLDRGDLFDVVNTHALGYPDEIRQITTWLKHEMNKRGYKKPIVISDTTPNFLSAWGISSDCTVSPMIQGVLTYPVVEQDRCRLAAFFNRVLAEDRITVKDKPNLEWLRKFVAEDTVKKVVVAAGEDVMLMNTAYTEDLYHWKWGAGAGTSAWAGMVEIKWVFDQKNKVWQPFGTLPNYHALGQILRHLHGYTRVVRQTHHNNGIPFDPQVRIYLITKVDGSIAWVAWVEPDKLILPEDPVPTYVFKGWPGGSAVEVEYLATAPGQKDGNREVIPTPGGELSITLTPSPILVTRIE